MLETLKQIDEEQGNKSWIRNLAEVQRSFFTTSANERQNIAIEKNLACKICEEKFRDSTFQTDHHRPAKWCLIGSFGVERSQTKYNEWYNKAAALGNVRDNKDSLCAACHKVKTTVEKKEMTKRLKEFELVEKEQSEAELELERLEKKTAKDKEIQRKQKEELEKLIDEKIALRKSRIAVDDEEMINNEAEKKRLRERIAAFKYAKKG